MPIYGYVCENKTCAHDFEIEQKMIDDALVKCPLCKKKTLVRKIYVPSIFIKGEPTTVGHQASRNTEKLGHYEYEDKMEARKSRIRKATQKTLEATGGQSIEHSGELPWWRSGKVAGLPKKERPLQPTEAAKLAQDLGIKTTEPRKKRKKNGK